jgi:hypothetical protein
MIMEAADTSETSIKFYQSRRRNKGFIPEDENSMFLRNVDIYATPKPRRTASLSSPP